MGRGVLVKGFGLHSAQQGGRRRQQLPTRNVYSAVICCCWGALLAKRGITVPADADALLSESIMTPVVTWQLLNRKGLAVI